VQDYITNEMQTSGQRRLNVPSIVSATEGFKTWPIQNEDKQNIGTQNKTGGQDVLDTRTITWRHTNNR